MKKPVVMSKEELDKVLQWCNKIRKRFELEPVMKIFRADRPGRTGLSESCPIAMTLIGESRGVIACVGKERFTFATPTHLASNSHLPEVVQKFVSQYDAGKLRRFKYRAPTKKSGKRR